MIAVQRRSGKRHLVHPDGLATYCGRFLRRTGWRRTNGRVCDCKACLRVRMSEARRLLAGNDAANRAKKFRSNSDRDIGTINSTAA